VTSDRKAGRELAQVSKRAEDRAVVPAHAPWKTRKFTTSLSRR